MREEIEDAPYAHIDRGSTNTTLTRAGLQISDHLTFEDWENVGRQLSSIVDSSTWCLGDWLVYGKNHFPDRYEIAIRSAGLRYQTLRNYSWVSRRFELGRRRPALSFQHHAEVASLPSVEQDYWLDEAQREKWTTKQLRTRIRNAQPSAGNHDTVTSLPTEMARIPVVSNRLYSWREAASKAGMDFDRWVTVTLDQAATRALTDGTALSA